MIRNQYKHIPHPTLNTMDTDKILQTPTKDTHSKPNEELFPKQVVLQVP